MSNSQYLKIFGRGLRRRPSVAIKVIVALAVVSSLALGAMGLLVWGGISVASNVLARTDAVGEIARSSEIVQREVAEGIAQLNLVSCGEQLSQMTEVSTWFVVPFKDQINQIRRACFGPASVECGKEVSCDESSFNQKGVSS